MLKKLFTTFIQLFTQHPSVWCIENKRQEMESINILIKSIGSTVSSLSDSVFQHEHTKESIDLCEKIYVEAVNSIGGCLKMIELSNTELKVKFDHNDPFVKEYADFHKASVDYLNERYVILYQILRRLRSYEVVM